MANTLKITQSYDNPYEAAYNMSKGNPWFNQKDWDVMAKRGRLDDYLTIMGQTDKLPNLNKFNEKYRLDLMDTDRRFTAMANELYADREKEEMRHEIRFDPVQGKEIEFELGKMTDYDYTSYLLQQYKNWKLEEINKQQQQDRKDAMNAFQKAGAFVTSMGGEFALGTMDFIDDFSSMFEGIVDGLNEMANGGRFDDGFRKSYQDTDWALFENLGWQEAILEWESKYSSIRDIDGNYTNIGKYVGGVLNSLGKAAPSIAINLAGVGLTKLGVSVPKGLGQASTALYFTGLGSGSFKDLVNDPRMISVPTWQLMANASVKTVTEYLIMKGMSAVFGPSNMDKLVFGQTAVKAAGQATFATAIKRIAMDFMQEGLEEMYQNFSGFLWDKTFGIALNDKFGQLSEWNMQTALDAFILGGLSTIGTSAVSVITTKRVDVGDRKLGKFASYVFNGDLQSLATNYDKVLNNNKLSNEQRLQAVGQMYASYRTITSIYGEIGKERFEAATKLLKDMKEAETKRNLTVEQIKTNATIIFDSIADMQIQNKTKVVDNIIKAGITKKLTTHNKGDDLEAALPAPTQAKVRKVVESVLYADKNIQRVVLTQDGTAPVVADSAVFVPIKYAMNDDGTMILHTIAEQNLVKNVMLDSSLKQVLSSLKKLFESITNRSNVDMGEVVYNLFFNNSFYEIALQVSNADMLQVLSALDKIAEIAITDSELDVIYLNKIEKSLNDIKASLANYLVLQQNAEYKHLSILTNEQKDAITRKRWSLDLANRIIKGEKLSEEDMTLIKSRVNAMPAKIEVKNMVLDNIVKKDQGIRTNALATIERYYRDVFNSPYNNITYLTNDTIPNVQFNRFLKLQGLTVDKLLQPIPPGELYTKLVENYGSVTPETLLKYYQEQFLSYTNGKYSFTYANSVVTIMEEKISTQQGYDAYKAKRGDIITGKGIKERSIITLRKDVKGLLDNVVSQNVTSIQKSYMTIKDVILNPEMLTDKMQTEIKTKYHELNSMNTFLYLRDYYLEKYRNITITILPDGGFAFADVTPMLETLKQKEINNSMVTNNSTLKDFIADEFLEGRLVDTKIVSGTDTYYNIQTNTITIDKNLSNDPKYLRFALLHEFQHAIQAENQLNGGLSESWLTDSTMTKTLKTKLINDVKKHKPELFKDVKANEFDKQLQIAQQFIYDTSGESQAYGVDTNKTVVDFYPTIVRYRFGKTTIITPWGTKYTVEGTKSSLSFWDTEILPVTEYEEYQEAYEDNVRKMPTAQGIQNYAKYKDAFNKLRQDVPEINIWARLGTNIRPETKTYNIHTADKRANEVVLKQQLLSKITPDIKHRMLDTLRLKLVPDVPMTKFLEMDLPYIRVQTKKDLGNDPFVSLTIGRDDDMQAILNMFVEVKERYVFTGTIKPKELLGAIASSETEVLVKPSQLKDANVFTADYVKENMSVSNVQRMSMAKQPGDRTFISKKRHGETNLKYFVGKLVPDDTRDFIVNADASKLEPKLWSLIGGDNKGQLTQQKIFAYLRTADKMNDYTFNLINDHFFQNDAITTFKDLEYVLNTDLAQYYALSIIMKHTLTDDIAFERTIYDVIDNEQFKSMIAQLSIMPDVKNYFESLIGKFNKFKGFDIDVDYEAMRIAFMKYFDGSIDSALHVALIGKLIASHHYKTPGKFTTYSLDATAKGTDMELSEVIADPDTQDTFDTIVNEKTMKEKEDLLVQFIIQKTNLSIEQAIKIVDTLSDAQVNERFLQIDLSEISNTEIISTDEVIAKKELTNMYIRPDRNIGKNIRNLASRIKNILTTNKVLKKDMTKVIEVHSDIFNDDLSLKKSMLEHKTRDQLLELEEQLRVIAKDIRMGVYHSKKIEDIKKQLKRTQERLAREQRKTKSYEQEIKDLRNRRVDLGGYEFTINSNMEIPLELKAILDTTFDIFHKTDVQFLSAENEQHMRMTLKTFIEQNAQRLSALTQQDVDDIINFYINSTPTGATNSPSLIKYGAFKIYMLSYLIEQSRNGMWLLSEEQLKGINNHLQATISGAATELAAWKSAMHLIDPNKQIINSLARSSGLQFREVDVKRVTDAIRSKNVVEIKQAMDNLYEQGLRLYKGRKRSFWNKAWKLQRMFMLSSPGTAIRNLTSNTLLTVGNDASSILGKLLSKIPAKFRKTKMSVLSKQYQITGTKVSTDIQMFVKTHVIDTGLLKLISDGLNKYDVQKSQNKLSSQIMTDLITRSVTSKIFNANQFDSKVLQKMSDTIFKFLTDDPFINKTTLKYFGKMLQEDNHNVALGLNNDAMNTLAEAYTLAAWDYMHKPNFFNKLDDSVKKTSGDAGYFAYKQLLPFASASWNWFKEGLMYTPVGLVKGILDFVKLEKSIERMEDIRMRESKHGGAVGPTSRFAQYIATRNIGKGVIGSIGLGIGVLLGILGIAGIDEEDDKVKLRIGDTYVDISGIFGTQGIFLGISLTNPRKGNWQGLTVDVLETMFSDSTLTDLFNTFRYSDSIGDWLLNQPSQMLSTMVPNFIKAISRLSYTHKVQYSPGIRGQFERITTSIPGLAYLYPKQVDIYTGKVQSKYSIPFLFEAVNILMPFKIAKYEVTDTEKLMLELGLRKGNLTGKYKDIGNLNPSELEKLNTKYGELNAKSLQEFISNKKSYTVQMPNGSYKELKYSAMTDEQRKNVAERLMSNNAKYAKIYIYTYKGGSYYASIADYNILRKLGISNVFKETPKKTGFI